MAALCRDAATKAQYANTNTAACSADFTTSSNFRSFRATPQIGPPSWATRGFVWVVFFERPDSICAMSAHSEWVVLDTETSGLDYPIFIVEMAAQRMCGTESSGEPFRVFLNHNIDIPVPAQAVHGYTRDYLAKVGIAPEAAHSHLREYVGDRPIVAHFLRYDWNSALLPEWRRLRLSHISAPGFCSWMLAKRCVPSLSSYRLDALRAHFGVPSEGAHSAIGDVRAVVEILTKFIFPRLQARGLGSFEQIRDFATWTPLLRCHCLIEDKDFALEFARVQDERRQRAAIAREKEREARAKEAAAEQVRQSLLYGEIDLCEFASGFIVDEPEIIFEGRKFMFTGGMAWGSRTKVVPWVEELGGTVATSKVMNQSIDYLVLGEDMKLGWQQKSGSKLADAIYLQMLGRTETVIVRESDFIDKLTAELATRA
jgi:DNA polymerase III epsilon subunit-like protein